MYIGHIKNSNINPAVDIRIETCAAYEMVSLARQKIHLKDNPAYEEIGQYSTVNSPQTQLGNV